MAVKPGYKQTEMGMIPEDWELRRLDEVADFLDGRRRPVKDADRAKMRGDIPYYGASGIVDYVNDYLFDDQLILLGEDGENILSRNCRLAFRVSGKVWVNNHAHVLKPKNGNDIGYLADFLESLSYDQYNTGTAQPKLNKQVCSAIPVAIPPPPNNAPLPPRCRIWMPCSPSSTNSSSRSATSSRLPCSNSSPARPACRGLVGRGR